MVMIFSNPKVREFLLEHGLVYTYRKHHKKTEDGVRPQIGKDWATDRRTGSKIADIFITPMESINDLNKAQVLTKYHRESGFYKGFYKSSSGRVIAVLAWTSAINSLNPDKPILGWIYKVEIRNL